MRSAACILSLLFALPAAAAPPGPIHHEPVECVPAGRYARIVAAPGADAARAELQFRTPPDGPWYAARMEKRGTEWVGHLPRVERATGFEYRVLAVASDLKTAETAPITVRVATDEAPCPDGAAYEAALTAPILVRVPQGAPLVPPVPSGFSPAGVVAEEAPAPRSRWGAAKWIAGGAAAAGIAAATTGVGSAPPPPPDAPDFAFSGATPSPGGELSLHGGRLSVFVTVSGEPREPLDFTWVFQLHSAVTREACVLVSGVASVGAERPVTLELTGPLRDNFICGSRYDVQSTQLTIVVEGQIVHDATEPLVYHVVP
jgi:hypothetical protein